MKTKILQICNQNTIKQIGNDGKYHTVYLITFSTGHFYIGKRTSIDVDTDEYFASGKLPNRLKEQNIDYTRTILFYLPTSDGAINIETSILQNKDIYDDEMCLNCYPGSPPCAVGYITIKKNNKIKRINPKSVNAFLDLGWTRGGLKKLCITDGQKNKYILPTNLDYYLNQNWIVGRTKEEPRTFIEKCGLRKYVKNSLVPSYIEKGWIVKHNVQDRKVLKKGTKLIKVQPGDEEVYKKLGYINTSTVDGLIYITKDRKFKRVPANEVDTWITNGWKKGNNKSGQIYVTNGIIEKRIYPDQIEDGWWRGRLKKVYLNNGLQERRIFEKDIDEINKYLTLGYSYGILKRSKKPRE